MQIPMMRWSRGLAPRAPVTIYFAKEYIALLPRSSQLVELLLREEFGGAILEALTLLPGLGVVKERNKCARREKHALLVAGARKAREGSVRSWPQAWSFRMMLCTGAQVHCR